MKIRTTEQLAPENIAAHLDVLRTIFVEFSRLTIDQPTTAELEEAQALVPKLREACDKALSLIDHDLRVWIGSRHLIGANAHLAAQFRQVHPEVAAQMEALNPERQAWAAIAAEPVDDLLNELEDKAMDELDHQSKVHPVFAPILNGLTNISGFRGMVG